MWARRAERGTQATFPELYRQYGERLYRVCLGLCGNATDAEDLVQEVFVLAFEHGEQFEGRAAFSTWLYKIAVRKWRRMRPDYESACVSLAELGPEPADPFSGPLLGLILEEAMARLPEPLLEAFLLVKVEGLRYHEAAEVLEVPIGTVQGRVYYARRHLQALLSEPQTTVREPEATPIAVPSPT